MESSGGAEGGMSLLDSNFSANSYQMEKDQMERLKRQLRALESENTELRRSQPRLLDAQGKDYTEEIVKMDCELRLAKDQCERWKLDYTEMSKKYEKFEQFTMSQLDERDKQIAEIRKQAMDLEEENEQLRGALKDEKSRIFHLQAGQFDRTQEEMEQQYVRDLINADLSKLQLNESIGNLDISDADQIATHLLMILERLDKNHRDAEELQGAIFAFLAEHGFSGDADKFSAFSNVYKELVNKRLAELRAGNEELRSKLPVGDKEFEACMKHLIQESISLSTTFPSFAGYSKEAVFQPAEISLAEAEQPIDSTIPMNLASRTSALAETCVRMFEKLRGTAEFFQTMLKTLGVTGDDLGEDIMQKIELMKLDLNKSIGEARSIVAEAKESEKSMRSVLFDHSQAMINFNSTAYSTIRDESEKCEKTAENVPEEKELDSTKTEQFRALVETLQTKLDSEFANKQELNKKLSEQCETIEQFKAEKEELVAKIQELEAKVCEKCQELEEMYQSAKSALDKELYARELLQKQLDEQLEANKKLMEEIELTSSAAKENVITEETRKKLVEQAHQELHSIFDTMNFATSHIKTAAGSSSVAKKKTIKSAATQKRIKSVPNQLPSESTSGAKQKREEPAAPQ